MATPKTSYSSPFYQTNFFLAKPVHSKCKQTWIYTHRPSTPIMANSKPYRLFVKTYKSANRKVFGRKQMARKSFIFFSSYLPVHIANGRNERKESSQRYHKLCLSHHTFRISNYSNYSILQMFCLSSNLKIFLRLCQLFCGTYLYIIQDSW